jgi:hypothetical protein
MAREVTTNLYKSGASSASGNQEFKDTDVPDSPLCGVGSDDADSYEAKDIAESIAKRDRTRYLLYAEKKGTRNGSALHARA